MRLRGKKNRILVKRFLVAILLVLSGVVFVKYQPLIYGVLFYSSAPKSYLIPVRGVKKSSLVSTFGAPRPGGRKHKGIDIFAPRGTPVLASVESIIWRIFQDHPLGGRMIYAVGKGRTVYVYSHLNAFAAGLHEGQKVKKGEVIGFVGNSGNAKQTPPHLHFGMVQLNFNPFDGFHRAVDPYPYLLK